MNKKTIIFWIVIILLLIGGLVYYFQFSNNKKFEPSYFSNGRIVEAKQDSIVVSGVVKSEIDSYKQENRTIEFKITSKTSLKNNVIVITEEQIKSGEKFHPETKQMVGLATDLVVDTRVIRINSDDDLFTINQATAIEIEYASYDFPDEL